MPLTPSLAEKIEGVTGIVVSIIVWLLRYIVAIATLSAAALVDAWHALIDALTSAIVVAASIYADRPADEEHPYGHGRALALGSNIIGLVVVSIGAYLVYETVQRYVTHEVSLLQGLSTLYVTVFALTGVVKLGQWYFAKYLGEKYNSRLCIADSKHHLADGIITVFVTFSLVLTYITHVHLIDIAVALAICGFIVREGVKIMRESSSILLDRTVPALAKKVIEVAKNVNGVREVKNVRVRDFGRYYVAEVDLLLDPSLSLREAHELAHKVEHEIKKRIPEIQHVHTHYAPEEKSDEKEQRH